MTVQTFLLWGAAVLYVVLGVVLYLLMVASSRASQTEARVQALLRAGHQRENSFSGGAASI